MTIESRRWTRRTAPSALAALRGLAGLSARRDEIRRRRDTLRGARDAATAELKAAAQRGDAEEISEALQARHRHRARKRRTAHPSSHASLTHLSLVSTGPPWATARGQLPVAQRHVWGGAYRLDAAHLVCHAW